MKKVLSIIAVIMVLFSSVLPVFAFAEEYSYTANFSEPEVFIDGDGYVHNYVVVYNAGSGYLIEFLLHPSDRVTLASSNIGYLRFDLNISDDITVNSYNLDTGSLIFSLTDYFTNETLSYYLGLPNNVLDALTNFYSIGSNITRGNIRNPIYVFNDSGVTWSPVTPSYYTPLFSSLSRPYADDLTRYVVLSDGVHPYIYMFQFQRDPGANLNKINNNDDYQFASNSAFNVTLTTSGWYFNFYSTETQDFLISCFDGITGSYISSTVYSSSIGTFNLHRSSDFDQFLSYGIPVLNNSSIHLSLSQLVWNENNEESTYHNLSLELLEAIKSHLLNISVLEASEYSELVRIYNFLYSSIDPRLDDIYDLLGAIYDLMSEDQEEDTTVSTSTLDEFESREAELLRDQSADLDEAFSGADSVFNVQAVGSITSLLSSTVFAVPELAGLIIILLCFGLVVLILGRKVS